MRMRDDQFNNPTKEETMPTLTIKALRENPWNVLSHELPPHPSPVLLALALVAADYTRHSENMLMLATLASEDAMLPWPLKDLPCRQECENRAFLAFCKFEQIADIFKTECGELIDEECT
jgi:hypothetical protein